MTHLSSLHREFVKRISSFVDKSRIYTDELRRLTWGTDAGFYRLIPQVVVRAASEAEVSRLLNEASRLALPVTFRAAGTSLSGQAISDSILIVAGKHWENYTINEDASLITMQPGIIGARVNELLAPFGRMFAPDPASKKSAMVGGIIINNASGMNCGTHANSDRVLLSARLILADGTVLDTGNAESRRDFAATHAPLIKEIESIRDDIRADAALCERIRRKYSIKNVTGLNLLPFVLYDDPFDIITHCLVGSEGTLAFLSEATVKTSHLYPLSASAMVYFTDMAEACRAVVALKKGAPVHSCEMLDKKSLASVHDPTDGGRGLTALLMDTKADTEQQLQQQIDAIIAVLADFSTYMEPSFSTDPAVTSQWWSIRSGVFPAVGGTRPIGTTALIEDVAFHIDDLPRATADLEALLVECGYDDACIYGHALEGNYHFIIAQRFDTAADIDKYRTMMLKLEQLVVDKYDGSLKAEHGTGRNMAPFVAKEWGTKAYAMMQRLKHAFDPMAILNPGVIFNADPECYIKGMKPLPPTSPRIDKCIECGFCEVNCVSCGLTLSARQRIVAQREMARLRADGSNPQRLAALTKQFRYLGNETCAGDGLCSTSCPMGINTGELIHDLRQAAIGNSGPAYNTGAWAARHLGGISATLRGALTAADMAHKVIGDKGVNIIGRVLHSVGAPLWTAALPAAAHKLSRPQPSAAESGSERIVVYLPSCINRTMGASHHHDADAADSRQLSDVIVALCQKAGYTVRYPEDLNNLCCGMIWESKGMPDIADSKTAQTEQALLKASENGRYPVLCDQSPCLHRLREHITSMHLYEPAEFIADVLAEHLDFHPTDTHIAVHVTCSTRRMGLAAKIIDLARRCSSSVTVPAEIGCCGFAGDKGFTTPELNAYALRKLKASLEKAGVTHGYSNSRTCEIGLTTNSGIQYQSIAYLVDKCTTPKL